MSKNAQLSHLDLLDKHIRIAALLVCIGLSVTLASLLIEHPLSFIGFAIAGVFVMLVGIVYYLLSLVRMTRRAPGIDKLS